MKAKSGLTGLVREDVGSACGTLRLTATLALVTEAP